MRNHCFSHVAICLLAVSAFTKATSAGELFPEELTSFATADSSPVFTAQGEGHWDVKIRERGWILRTGKGSETRNPGWVMWYTGYDGTREGKKKLGVATSEDGITWKRMPKPVFDAEWVEDMMIVPHNDVFFMFAEGRDDQAHLLTSADGLKWKRVGVLDVRMANGEPIEPGPYGTPTAFHEDGVWYLFYERRDKGIWLATSQDMKVWTNVSNDPVMVPGPDKFDRDLIAMNQVFKYKDRYYASIHGSVAGSKLWANGIAVSDDLRNWKKYSRNPLRPISENKSSGLFIHDGKQFRFYTMHGEVHVHFPTQK